jgi:hypothetical protein
LATVATFRAGWDMHPPVGCCCWGLPISYMLPFLRFVQLMWHVQCLATAFVSSRLLLQCPCCLSNLCVVTGCLFDEVVIAMWGVWQATGRQSFCMPEFLWQCGDSCSSMCVLLLLPGLSARDWCSIAKSPSVQLCSSMLWQSAHQQSHTRPRALDLSCARRMWLVVVCKGRVMPNLLF